MDSDVNELLEASDAVKKNLSKVRTTFVRIGERRGSYDYRDKVRAVSQWANVQINLEAMVVAASFLQSTPVRAPQQTLLHTTEARGFECSKGRACVFRYSHFPDVENYAFF